MIKYAADQNYKAGPQHMQALLIVGVEFDGKTGPGIVEATKICAAHAPTINFMDGRLAESKLAFE